MWCAGLGIFLLSCAVASAQPGQGGRPGGFGGGFGGPGGPGGFGGPGGELEALQLLNNQAVKKELDIAGDQEDSLKTVGQEIRDEMRKEIEGLRAKYEAKLKAKLTDVLLPNQLERLEQIAVQNKGNGIYNDAAILEKLGVTEDQKAQMTALRDELAAKGKELFQGGKDLTQEERKAQFEAFNESRKELQEKIQNVLTSEQREALTRLQGEPFDVQALRRGFGGFGGQGGPGGPGGQRRPGGNNNNNNNN